MSSTVWCAPVSRSPRDLDVEVDAPVARQQIEHVVEEADAGLARARRRCRRGPARARRSVSLVLRLISARARHGGGLSRSLHRRRVALEALGARDRRAGARQRRRGGADAHLAHAPAEVPRRQRGGEARGAAGGQHVVGARDVVAEGGRAVAPDEDAAGAADARRERLGVGADQLEVLGRERLGEGQRRLERRARRTSARGRRRRGVERRSRRAAPGRRSPRRRASPRRARPGRAGRAPTSAGSAPSPASTSRSLGPAKPSMPTSP